MYLKQALYLLTASVMVGKVPRSTETKGAGAADSHRERPSVGRRRHQDLGLCDLHEPGLSPESHVGGIHTTNLLSLQIQSGQCLIIFSLLNFCQEKHERYLMLFPHILLMLSASPRMSGFIFQASHSLYLLLVVESL